MMNLLEREELLGQLTNHLERARDGSGSMVLVAGEAGSGKTSLVRVFVQQAGQRALTLIGACDPLSTPRPLGPLVDFAADEDSGLGRLFEGTPDNIEIFSRVLERVRHTIRPILILVEDIHWADQATLDFLRFVARRIEPCKAVIICTYRDDEIGPDHSSRPLLGQLTSLPTTRRLTVPPLTEEAVAALARGRAIDPAELHRRTGGNAFFVTEVLAGGEELPASVQDAVVARVSRLAHGPRAIVEAVSIAPRALGVDWAIHLIGASAEDVDQAVGSGVILGDGQNLRFRHELARSAVENSLPPGRRYALHTRMISLLLEDDPPDPARLAHHAIGAHEPHLIVEYAPVAAELAAARGAHKEAVELLEAALSNPGLMESDREMSLRLDLARQLGIVDRQADAVEQAQRAVTHFRAEGDPVALGGALIALSQALWRNTDTTGAQTAQTEALALLEPTAPSKELAFALYTSGYEHMLARRAEDSIDHLDRALNMAREVGARDLLWDIEMIRGTIEIVLGNPDRAVGMLQSSLDTARRAGDRQRVASALGMLGSGGGEARVYDKAIAALEQGIEWGKINDQDYSVAYDRSWLARIAFEQGRWDDAVSIADEVDQTSVNREGIAMVTALGAKGRVLVRRGQPEGRPLLEEVVELGTRHEIQHVWSPICGLAEYHWMRGDHDVMTSVLEDAYERALGTDSEWARGEVGFWMWRAGAIEGPPENAAEPFALQMSGKPAEAAEAWRRLGCPYEIGLALLDGTADDVLESLGIFDTLGARPAGSMARARLRELGVDRIPRGPTEETRANPAGLTGRQLEVLEMMGAGLSNAEIARELFISKKTVEHHVSAIYSKLGVDTRARAIAEASNLGIG